MQAKTEELLYVLLWTCEMLTRPTFRNLSESFEGWAYRTGLHRQLARLERQQLIESQGGRARRDRVYRLTEPGRLRSLGGRDPEAQWRRSWDHKWRLVLFDFPLQRNRERDSLRRFLREQDFGCLQRSVWVSPDPLLGERQRLATQDRDVRSLIVLEAGPCTARCDDSIVAGAWSFSVINERYRQHLAILAQRPAGRLHNEAAAKDLRRWINQERILWQEAAAADPLLPEGLLPPGYLGRRAWRTRVEVLAEAAVQMRSFSR